MRKLIGFCCVAAVWAGGVRPSVSESPSPATGTGNHPVVPAARPGKQNPTAHVPEDAAYLVREVVYNELHDHDSHGYWRYWIEKRSSKERQLHEAVETPEGPVSRLASTNGKPLSVEALKEEDRRIDHLLTSPGEQAQHRKEYADDEHRIGRILALLPDAFVYESAGLEPRHEQMPECPCFHFRFHPNPNYPAHSIESRIFHAMSGDLWISSDNKRLVRLDGTVQDNVDFGYGILGRLYKGGWFQLERTKVTSGIGNGDWKTRKLEVHMSGRAMLFKTIARETSEVRGGFSPVAPGLSLQQAAQLVRQPIQAPPDQPSYQPAAYLTRP